MFFQTHLSPEIGSFEVTSQGVLQCLNETEVVHGLPGSRGSRAGRQAGRHPAQRSLLARQKTTPDSIPCTLLLVPPSAGVQSGVKGERRKKEGS